MAEISRVDYRGHVNEHGAWEPAESVYFDFCVNEGFWEKLAVVSSDLGVRPRQLVVSALRAIQNEGEVAKENPHWDETDPGVKFGVVITKDEFELVDLAKEHAASIEPIIEAVADRLQEAKISVI